MTIKLKDKLTANKIDKDFTDAFCRSLGPADSIWLDEFDSAPEYWLDKHIRPEQAVFALIAQFSSNDRYMIFTRQKGLNLYLLAFGRFRAIYSTDFDPLLTKYRASFRCLIKSNQKIAKNLFDLDPWWAQDPDVGDHILVAVKNKNRDERRSKYTPPEFDIGRYNKNVVLPAAASLYELLERPSTEKLSKIVEAMKLTNANSQSIRSNFLCRRGWTKRKWSDLVAQPYTKTSLARAIILRYIYPDDLEARQDFLKFLNEHFKTS